jgi:hypothetical protein
MMYNFHKLIITQQSNHWFSISKYYYLHSSWSTTTWRGSKIYSGPNSNSISKYNDV